MVERGRFLIMTNDVGTLMFLKWGSMDPISF